MSTHSYPNSAFNSARASTAVVVLRELFQATPLYIFAVAVRAAMRKSSQR
jgi:hypothetical protein